MKSNTVIFCEALGHISQGLSQLLEQHRQEFGEIIPHIFMANVMSYIIASASADERRGIVRFIHDAFTGEPDDLDDLENDVNNLIAVSFVENISTADELERVIEGVDADRLRKEWSRQQA